MSIETDGTQITPEMRGDVLPEAAPVEPEEAPPEAPEVEAEAEEELPEPEIEEEAEGPPKKADIMIPKARLDEVTRKNRELTEQLQNLQGQRQETQAPVGPDVTGLQTQIEELTDKYEELLIEGEKDKAREIRKQRDALNTQVQSMTAAQMTSSTRQAAIEDIRYDQTLTIYEDQYPAIKNDSEEFDQALVSEVAELKEAYQRLGHTPTAALKKAVNLLVAPKYVAPPAASAKDQVTDLRQQRATQAREKVVKAVKGQPPSAAVVGKDNRAGIGPADVVRMSQDDFAKLQPEELRKLRGDMV